MQKLRMDAAVPRRGACPLWGVGSAFLSGARAETDVFTRYGMSAPDLRVRTIGAIGVWGVTCWLIQIRQVGPRKARILGILGVLGVLGVLGGLGGFLALCGCFWGLRRVVGEPRSSGRGVFLPL